MVGIVLPARLPGGYVHHARHLVGMCTMLGTLVGIVLPGICTLPTLVGIHHPCYGPPYAPPGYTAHTTVLGLVSASAPGHAEVPDDEVLGSEKEVSPGWWTFLRLKVLKV